MLKANDPKLKSWVEIPEGSDFPIQNLPFGIFKTKYLSPVAGVAIGNYVLDLVYLHENGYLDGLGLPPGIFNQKYLNDFLALGKKKLREVSERVSELLRHKPGTRTMAESSSRTARSRVVRWSTSGQRHYWGLRTVQRWS